MARTQFEDVVWRRITSTDPNLDSKVEALADIQVTVYIVDANDDPTTTKATLYAARKGATTIANPFRTTDGSVRFYCDAGKYHIEFADPTTPARIPTKFISWDPFPAHQAKLPAGIGPLPFVGTVAPAGWLLCNGQVVSATTYPRLSTAIGTTYNQGNEGAGNFRLPDPLGRSVMFAGAGVGLTTRTAGQKIGTETVALTSAQLAAHSHLIRSTDVSSGTGLVYDLTSGGVAQKDGANPGAETNDAGSGEGHANVHPSLVMNAIISHGNDAL